MEINPDTVVVKSSIHGRGIFTTKDILKNTVFFKITGNRLPPDQTPQPVTNEHFELQTGLKKYIIPHYPFLLSNHSCDPNCGINPNMEFVSLKNISNGEELLWDYSTYMLEKCRVMKCNCGTPLCRGTIKDFNLLPVDVQEKYLKLGIVLPFIVKYIYGLYEFNKYSKEIY